MCSFCVSTLLLFLFFVIARLELFLIWDGISAPYKYSYYYYYYHQETYLYFSTPPAYEVDRHSHKRHSGPHAVQCVVKVHDDCQRSFDLTLKHVGYGVIDHSYLKISVNRISVRN